MNMCADVMLRISHTNCSMANVSTYATLGHIVNAAETANDAHCDKICSVKYTESLLCVMYCVIFRLRFMGIKM